MLHIFYLLRLPKTLSKNQDIVSLSHLSANLVSHSTWTDHIRWGYLAAIKAFSSGLPHQFPHCCVRSCGWNVTKYIYSGTTLKYKWGTFLLMLISTSTVLYLKEKYCFLFHYLSDTVVDSGCLRGSGDLRALSCIRCWKGIQESTFSVFFNHQTGRSTAPPTPTHSECKVVTLDCGALWNNFNMEKD